MHSFVAWLQQLDFSPVISGGLIVAASLLCITFHETCHGFVAWKLGDPTAKRMGRLTLNPIKHIDWFGLVMMAVFKFGWAKPVPVDMRYFKKPKRDMAITALAGPVSNVILTYAALLVRSVFLYVYLYHEGGMVLQFALQLVEYTAIISSGLAIFNLIPIPPLDGSKVLYAFLPDHAYRKLMQYERYGMLVLMAVLFVGILDMPLQFLRGGLLDGLRYLAWFPFTLLQKIV